MKVVAIIQARMGSTRLPGKVLAPLQGEPLILRVIQRAQRIPRVDRVIVATSNAPRDDVLVDRLVESSVEIYRGSEDDVLARYQEAAAAAEADVVVRITGDCPLICPSVSGAVVQDFLEHSASCDYASNTRIRTFPRGLDTEVMSAGALARAFREATSPSDREHVTPFIWRNPDAFALRDWVDPVDRSHFRLTVDTPEDLSLAERLYEALHPRDPFFDYAAILECLTRHPEWAGINQGIEQKPVQA